MESLREKIENNEITPEQIIKAAITQLKSTPSLLEIVEQEEILPKDQLANLIIKSSETNTDFLSILREELGDISSLLEKKRNQSKPLRAILDELNQQSADDQGQSNPIDEETSGQQSDNDSVSDAAMDSLKELIESGQIDPSALEDFNQSSDTHESEDGPEQPPEREEDDQDISDAALESLKEQVEAGVISPEVLEEFQSQANSNTSPSQVSNAKLSEDDKNELAQVLSKSLLHELSLEFKGLTSLDSKNLRVALDNLKNKFDSLSELTAEYNVNQLRELCLEMGSKINLINQSPHTKQNQLIALYKLFALIVKVKKGILETGSEESVSNDPSFDKNLIEIRNKFE